MDFGEIFELIIGFVILGFILYLRPVIGHRELEDNLRLGQRRLFAFE